MKCKTGIKIKFKIFKLMEMIILLKINKTKIISINKIHRDIRIKIMIEIFNQYLIDPP